MKTQIVFHGCRVLGSDENTTVSRISFSIIQNGKEIDGFRVDVKKAASSPIGTANVEVESPIISEKRLVDDDGRPVGFEGHFNFAAFRQAAEEYFKGCFGPDAEFDKAQAEREEVVELPGNS
ncbi:MAG: hypothetical protein V3T83_04135 [Acidobacteriota bacterium]